MAIFAGTHEAIPSFVIEVEKLISGNRLSCCLGILRELLRKQCEARVQILSQKMRCSATATSSRYLRRRYLHGTVVMYCRIANHIGLHIHRSVGLVEYGPETSFNVRPTTAESSVSAGRYGVISLPIITSRGPRPESGTACGPPSRRSRLKTQDSAASRLRLYPVRLSLGDLSRSGSRLTLVE